MAFGFGFVKEKIMKVKEFFNEFDINPISTSLLHGPITPEMLQFIRERNEEKRLASIELLGDKWLLHPSNKAQRKEAP